MRKWQQDRLLLVSRNFVNQEITEKLAVELLDGKQPGGGTGFISNCILNGEHITWANMAYKVLKHWRENYKFDSVLLEALRKTSPNAASEFEGQLLNNDAGAPDFFR